MVGLVPAGVLAAVVGRAARVWRAERVVEEGAAGQVALTGERSGCEGGGWTAASRGTRPPRQGTSSPAPICACEGRSGSDRVYNFCKEHLVNLKHRERVRRGGRDRYGEGATVTPQRHRAGIDLKRQAIAKQRG